MLCGRFYFALLVGGVCLQSALATIYYTQGDSLKWLPFLLGSREPKTPRGYKRTPLCDSGLRHDQEPQCRPRKKEEPSGCPKTECVFIPQYGELVTKNVDKKSEYGNWKKIAKTDNGGEQKIYVVKVCKYPNKTCDCSSRRECSCSNRKGTFCRQTWKIKYEKLYVEEMGDLPAQSKRRKTRSLTAEEEQAAIDLHFDGATDFGPEPRTTTQPRTVPTRPPRRPTTRPTMRPTERTSTEWWQPPPSPHREEPPFLPPQGDLNSLMWQRFIIALTLQQRENERKESEAKAKDLNEDDPGNSRSLRSRRKVRIAIKIPNGCSCSEI